MKEVVINNLLDGIFYARLVCVKNGKEFEIDSRTSDALAMAVRFNCPIYTYEFILDAAGVILEEPEEGEPSESSHAPKKTRRKKKKAVTSGTPSLASHSIEELELMLKEVLGDEDYEEAAKIRDEIKKRKPEENE